MFQFLSIYYLFYKCPLIPFQTFSYRCIFSCRERVCKQFWVIKFFFIKIKYCCDLLIERLDLYDDKDYARILILISCLADKLLRKRGVNICLWSKSKKKIFSSEIQGSFPNVLFLKCFDFFFEKNFKNKEKTDLQDFASKMFSVFSRVFFFYLSIYV